MLPSRCVVVDSKNIGSTSGCDCPGTSTVTSFPPQGGCGMTMHDNSYFGDPKLPGNMTFRSDLRLTTWYIVIIV